MHVYFRSLVRVNNSILIEDVCKNNDKTPDKKAINYNDIFKKSMQNQFEEVIREKKVKI